MADIEVIIPQPLNVDVLNDVTSVTVTSSGGNVIGVSTGTTQSNLFVGKYTDTQIQNLLSVPGMILQTGLGPTGDDWTLWFDDGR